MKPNDLIYLSGYPEHLLDPVRALIAQNKLGIWLENRYPEKHAIQDDAALYAYIQELKTRYLKNAPALNKVHYNNKISLVKHALGLNISKAHVQGGNVKRRREIVIASVFKETAPQFLRMIAVHELAHLKETQHDKAFYQLCCHMEPSYHQLEFDLRLYLTHRDLSTKQEQ